MKLFYENKEIKLNTTELKVSDNISGKADSLSVTFSDIKSECTKWDFKKGDSIKVVNGNFSTGLMYVDRYSCSNGLYSVDALSIKKGIKTKNTRVWEKISFLDLAKDLAESMNLNLKNYGVEDFIYSRVDQIEKSDLAFLKERCILEGCVLKIYNGNALIISEEYIKKQSTVITISSDEIKGKYSFETTSNGIIGGVKLLSMQDKLIHGEYIKDSEEEILTIKDVYLTSNYEANRFSKNILNYTNRNESTGTFYIELNSDLASGNLIKLNDFNLFSGTYVIESIIHDFVQNISRLKVRKV